MKIKILTLQFALCLITNAQSPNWQWAKSAGGFPAPGGNHFGNSISTDANGNCYATGNFQVPNIVFGNDTLTSPTTNGTMMYVVKYDSSGNVQWANRPGGVGIITLGNGIATDANGNSYVTGGFSGTVIFGSTTLVGNGFCLVKYDNTGNVLWAKGTNGSSTNTQGKRVSIDANGNVYVTGTFSDPTITFGSYTLYNAYSSNPINIFAVKYDSVGNVLWAKSAGSNNAVGNKDVYTMGISTDANGNCYVTGYFHYIITIGAITLTGSSTGGDCVFIVKYDNAGNVVWAKGSDGTYPSSGTATGISADAIGNSYILGNFISPVFYIGTDTLTDAFGGSTLFIVKYDSAGNFRWAKQTTTAGNSNIETQGISTDAKGNSYTTGRFFGVVSFSNQTIFSNGNNDIFVAKYDSAGNALWAKGVGAPPQNAGGVGIALNTKGNCFVTGSFESPSMVFDGDTVFNTDMWGGSDNVFVAKLNSSDIAGVQEENNLLNEIIIYPNPTNGKIEVRSEKLEIRGLDIYNVLGKKMYSSNSSQTTGSRQQAIDISSLPCGIYFLQIKTPIGVAVRKIVKE
ncbi:MAG: T9SS type A sorting domain-containing protein [Bacteroidetes bacterium]|nr:T9SS type A sorting domain-containing protein [Bacteroidota bacterium]